MNEENNHIDENLFHQWQQESENNSQQLNLTEMEKLLKKASSDFSGSIKKTLKLDMIFKLCLMAGFLFILFLYMDNSFVLFTSTLFILTGLICLAAENLFLKGIGQVQSMERGIEDLIRDELKFYRSNLIRYPVVLSVSIAMFYALGSMIYHAVKYGYVNPFRDVTDVIVLTSLMLLGIIISMAANFPFFRSKINNLESLLKDLRNEDDFRIREKEIKLKKQITLALFILIGAAGLIALIYIILQLL